MSQYIPTSLFGLALQKGSLPSGTQDMGRDMHIDILALYLTAAAAAAAMSG